MKSQTNKHSPENKPVKAIIEKHTPEMRTVKVIVEKAPTDPQFVEVIVEKHTFPISMRSLLQRINRKIASKNEIIRASRGSRAKSELGDFFTLDVSYNCIVAKDVCPIDLAKELGILKPYEHVIL